ncbi:hypothetical protein CVT25_001304 [Psilocybe cyanescens]|uniref:Terpene synthase n=1 Tax=Psilocybe cyanescens TaxID=93625 RepID=A0A409XEQ7_PSICY|nr:hypothetical protein CVT25_001304 [Psilocybe cyanescens]
MTTTVSPTEVRLEDSLQMPLPNSDCNESGQHHWQATFKEIVTKFVEDLEYCPEDPITDENATYQAVRSEFSTQYDSGNKWFDQMYRTAVTMGEIAKIPNTTSQLPYPDHAPEIRLEIARFTCFLLHVDDLGKDFNTLEGLQKRIFMGDNSDGTFLQAFRKHLIGFYQYYDAIQANSITLAAIDCINGMLLEQNDAIRDMKLSDCSQSWPNYLRNKTGCSAAYAFMLFPKTMNLDLTDYISVIEDIVFFTNAVNDILSFYKEYLSGETDTYVFLRARITEKPLDETLRDVVAETLAAHARATKVLEAATCTAVTWKRYVNGYL